MKNISTMKAAQKFVKSFAHNNGWVDSPNIDKFDHLHEELIEMSCILRYKSEKDRVKAIKEHREEFVDGVGDLFFGLCRLANQLDVDINDAFNLVKNRVLNKYNGAKSESKPKKR